MEFLSDVEAAQMLKCTVSGLKQLGVHKCPYGYHKSVIEEFVAVNGLPICEDIYHIIGCASEIDRPAELDVEWYDTTDRVLVACNSRTRAIITDIAFSQEQYNAVVTVGIKIFHIGDGSGQYHMSLPSWEEAYDMANSI